MFADILRRSLPPDGGGLFGTSHGELFVFKERLKTEKSVVIWENEIAVIEERDQRQQEFMAFRSNEGVNANCEEREHDGWTCLKLTLPLRLSQS